MLQTSTQRLAKSLRFLVSVLIGCNIIALLFVPVLVYFTPETLLEFLEGRVLHWLNIQPYGEDDIYIPILGVTLLAWMTVWNELGWLLYTLFMFICGVCTLFILRQAHDILDTILEGEPFQMVNAVCMRRAAICCWVISGVALVRLIVDLLAVHKNLTPFFTYNTLCIPVFLVGGLLFLVMSTLFRQAAELQEDQDLTI